MCSFAPGVLDIAVLPAPVIERRVNSRHGLCLLLRPGRDDVKQGVPVRKSNVLQPG